jgi:hypothetical protein
VLKCYDYTKYKLKQQLEIMTTEQAKEVLRNAGYYVDNLWTIQDVQDRFECNDERAQEILHDALTDEYIVEQIFEQIFILIN